MLHMLLDVFPSNCQLSLFHIPGETNPAPGQWTFVSACSSCFSAGSSKGYHHVRHRVALQYPIFLDRGVTRVDLKKKTQFCKWAKKLSQRSYQALFERNAGDPIRARDSLVLQTNLQFNPRSRYPHTGL